jgi:hypothetical protein
VADRSDERRELFWKQLQRAQDDVQAWPEYVKEALITTAASEPPPTTDAPQAAQVQTSADRATS